MEHLFMIVLYFSEDGRPLETFEYLIHAKSVREAILGVMKNMSSSHQNFDRLTIEDQDKHMHYIRNEEQHAA